VGFLLVTLLSIFSATHLTLDPNMMALLPPDHPTTQAIARVNAEEGGANLVTLTFRGEDPVLRDQALGRLVEAMEAVEGVDYALYDLDEELAWQLGMLQLTVAELDAIQTRLQGAVALGPAAANPFVAQRLLDLGPLTEKLARGSGSRAILPTTDALARVVVRPTGSAYNAAFAAPFMARLTDSVESFVDGEPALELVWIGGAHRHSVEDVETIRHDLTSTAGVSVVLVLVFISLAFRDLRATLLVFTPLLFANLWTTGMATLTVGSLNNFTSFYPAVLVGLGVDFSLHLYARYREERALVEDVEQAIYAAWDQAGPPCFTAAITSAGAFCALWMAGFGGFRQLGTLLGGGVLLCLASVLLMLPLLIVWRDRQEQRGRVVSQRPTTGDGSGWRSRLAHHAPIGKQ
jgi:predicted exporter